MKSGRFFGLTSDNSAGGLVINETFAKQLGWKDAIGKRIRFSSDTAMYPVIGVLKDFNYSSLHEAVLPLVMYLSRRTSNISIQFETAQIKNIIPRLENAWKKIEQRYPFEYKFLDEFFAANYGKEKQLVSIVFLFTVIAIFIACLGLYGLASFAIVRRTKEIGIRKVLGAPVLGIIMLLVKNFAKPVGLAFLVATPIVWYLINDWLQNFAYHIQIGWWLLAIPGILMLLIVFATVSFQTIKAAVANPVKSLRTE
jgi:putative ABC transport system permease protein